MARKKRIDWLTSLRKSAVATVKQARKTLPLLHKEVQKELGEGVQISVVRGKDDKRTRIDESKEGPVQGIFIGSRKAEQIEADTVDPVEVEVISNGKKYVWWRDLRFAIPTVIGLTSIVVSVILWLVDRALW